MSSFPPNRTHDISHISYHVQDLKAFGETLSNAATAAFPNRSRSRYTGAHVLLLSWEEDNLQVINEVLELQEVFRTNYGFETEEWKIPYQKSHNSLAGKLLRFVDDYDDKEHLLIVYYGGHGGMDDDRRCIWSCNGGIDSPEVRWFGLQTMLEEAKSDVLILLDCCAAASSAASSNSGITEVIAACGFETWTPGVGEHSFSRSLIDELKFLSTGMPFTAAMLHNKVLSRIKYWKPRFHAGVSVDPKDLWTEKRKTPVYIVLANESKQRSIELAPMSSILSPGTGIVVPPVLTASASSTVLSSEPSDSDSMDIDLSLSSLGSVWPDPDFKCPKILLSVALEDDQWLLTQSFTEWLKSIPAFVKYAHVEGLFQGDSSLLIISLPVAIWDLLPQNPAVTFIGFVRSSNLMIDGDQQSIPRRMDKMAIVMEMEKREREKKEREKRENMKVEMERSKMEMERRKMEVEMERIKREMEMGRKMMEEEMGMERRKMEMGRKMMEEEMGMERRKMEMEMIKREMEMIKRERERGREGETSGRRKGGLNSTILHNWWAEAVYCTLVIVSLLTIVASVYLCDCQGLGPGEAAGPV